MRIALLGCGNVAKAFISFLTRNSERLRQDHGLQVEVSLAANSKGCASFREKHFNPTDAELTPLEPADWHADPSRFAKRCLDAAVETVIEALPNNLKNGEPALSLDEQILRAGLNRGGKSGKDPIAATIMKDLLQLSKAEPPP